MSDLQPYQQQAIEELNQLWDRLIKLDIFLGSLEFLRLPGDEQSLLREQATHMFYYHRTLQKRVDAWGKPQEPPQ